MSPQPVAVVNVGQRQFALSPSGGGAIDDVTTAAAMMMMTSPAEHSFTNNKGLLNAPGQNNCFLNSAVQVSLNSFNLIHSISWLIS